MSELFDLNMSRIFDFKWDSKKLPTFIPNMFFCIYIAYWGISEYISAVKVGNGYNATFYVLFFALVFIFTILSCVFRSSFLKALFGSLAFLFSLFLFGIYVALDLGFAHFAGVAYDLFALAYVVALIFSFIIIFAFKNHPKIQFICEAIFFVVIAASLVEVIIFENIYIYIPFLSHLTSAFCFPLCINYWIRSSIE